MFRMHGEMNLILMMAEQSTKNKLFLNVYIPVTFDFSLNQYVYDSLYNVPQKRLKICIKNAKTNGSCYKS